MEATMSEISLGEQLSGARIVKHDDQSGLTIAWFGGHGIHAYLEDGTEAAFWNTGDFAENNASEEDVRESIAARIASQDFPY